MSGSLRTERTTVRRLADRGSHELDAILRILDEGLVCHVAFVADGQPYVIPSSYGRIDDRIYLHGSRGSRLMQTLASGAPVCVTVTLLDGLVLARSAFHHSMNYRSVVILGRARAVSDAEERLRALQAIVDHVVPGRWRDVRPPDRSELAQTTVVELPVTEASAKVRRGPPKDDAADLALPVWAGEIPLRLAAGTPVDDPALPPGTPVPPYATAYRRGT